MFYLCDKRKRYTKFSRFLCHINRNSNDLPYSTSTTNQSNSTDLKILKTYSDENILTKKSIKLQQIYDLSLIKNSHLKGDSITFTEEIKQSIDTNNAKPIFTKSYRQRS